MISQWTGSAGMREIRCRRVQYRCQLRLEPRACQGDCGNDQERVLRQGDGGPGGNVLAVPLGVSWVYFMITDLHA